MTDKDKMDMESQKALIEYRVQRARETLKEADVMRRESFYNAAINRLYYACFYTLTALFLKNDIQAKTHSGVKTMLGLHFVSKGKLPVEYAKTFSTLFEKRHSGEYDDFVYCDKEMADDLYDKAVSFVDAVCKLIEN